jgi:hypothetical protein
MVDAGMTLSDAGRVDAQADGSTPEPTTHQLECDLEFTRRIEQPDGVVSEQTSFAAELVDPSIDPETTRFLSVRRCGHAYFNDPNNCPTDATCTGSARIGPLDCALSTVGELEDGRAIFHCGNVARSFDESGSLLVELGQKWSRVLVTVEP